MKPNGGALRVQQFSIVVDASFILTWVQADTAPLACPAHHGSLEKHVQNFCRHHLRCTDDTSPHARVSTLFSVRTSHVITRVAQDILRSSKVIMSSAMSLLDIPSIPFPPNLIFTSCLTDATDWNQTRGWAAWPSGGSDPKHRLWAQVLLRCQ